MQLYYSPASPFARKVRVVLLETGLMAGAELVKVSPMAEDGPAVMGNPLSKIPALRLEDGSSLFDSPVICDYLQDLAGARAMAPDEAGNRLRTALAQALGDGLMDAAVAMVLEHRRPETEQSPSWLARWRGVIDRAVLAMQADVAKGFTGFGLGAMTYACALGYLDFRRPEIDWRTPAPDLSKWFAQMETRASLAATRPDLE